MKYIRHPDQPAEVDIKIVNGVFVKATHFRSAGMFAPQHAHEFAHLSYVASGAAKVFVDDDLLGDFTAPASIVIEARKKHLFEITEPNTVILCIHNADYADPDGEPPIAAENNLVMED